MSDKTEPPTPHRLKRARKDGDIAKSTHVTVAVSGLFWWLFLVVDAPHIYQVCVHVVDAVTQIDQGLPFAERYARVASALGGMLTITLATLGVGALAVIVPEAAQAGGVLAFKRLVPDLKRLDPVKGLKNLFGLKMLFETGITLSQFAILLFILWHAFSTWCAQLLPSFALSFGGQLSATGESIARLMGLMALSQLAPAAVDIWLQRIQWRRRLRMDKNEIKREHKDEDGDPHVKGRRRALHRELVR
ncbi:EscU/YscU/HrcU family type III secretion system export apparatus switch protein [Paraburkholderia sp. Tr-20389]|uniref:EscU/YscU/HrcU family type III secretion system export apparatus switch protein n=1 Tax=Paraburkholderia sp. Tr-20389 TaxID=2703903 RepID=UPI00197ED738|nr:EscU/YscU/HrcU family type III secretion system export apparatus switch protein [Paraburkholderia sp. Tr-20389]MBN3754984.1 EscU/YscU/HrcU family type III secretion system export apparatus switch protein [Paraburkholderia sp. Tr-20389]